MTVQPFPTDDRADVRALDARAVELARPLDDDPADEVLDVIPFGSRTHGYAVPVVGVQEVQRLQGVGRLPQAPPSLLGVTRVRSTVVPLFDLAVLLGLEESSSEQDLTWVLVLGTMNRSALAIGAEWVDGVKPQPVAGIFPSEAGQHRGSLGVTAGGVVVLDTEALLDAPPLFGAGAAAGQMWRLPSGDGAAEKGRHE